MGYQVYVLPQARREIDRLPGHIRQRLRRAVVGLRDDPCPPGSKQLTYDAGPERELWRWRLDPWRVVYLVDREWGRVYVLTVRRRPPYQYEDLAALLGEV